MRIIDGDGLKKQLLLGSIMGHVNTLEDVNKIIDFVPTIEAVPVVRCKDCKFYDTKNYYYGICKNNLRLVAVTDGNSFCSYGERKEKTNE